MTRSLSPGRVSLYSDLNIRLHCGYALEVLQGLLDVAQIEQVAACDGNGVPCRGSRRCLRGEADVADTTRHDRQGQCAGVEILRCGQDACRDESAGDDGVLHTHDDDIDAGAAKTAPRGAVMLGIRCFQSKEETAGVFAIEADAGNRGARCFFRWQQFDRRCLQRHAHVRRRFLLLTQNALTFLLTQQFLHGVFRRLCKG